MALMLHILPDEASSAPVDSRHQSFREGLGRALAVVEEIGGESSGPPRIAAPELRGPPRPEMDAYLEELAMKITAASAAGLEAIAALGDEKQAIVAETADLLYHLMVVLHMRDISLEEVLAELQSRTGQSGLAEKAARPRE